MRTCNRCLMVAADLESSQNVGSITEVSWYNGLDWEREWNTAQDVEDASYSQVSSSNITKPSSRSVVDGLLQTGTGVSFGKWCGGTSIYQSGNRSSLDTLWFKLTRSNCPSLFLVGCCLIDAAVPCKEVVDSDDFNVDIYIVYWHCWKNS